MITVFGHAGLNAAANLIEAAGSRVISAPSAKDRGMPIPSTRRMDRP